MSKPERETFSWQECEPYLLQIDGRFQPQVEARGRFFETGALRVYPPLVLPIPRGCRTLAEYVRQLPPEPGRHWVVLLQAGAASLGCFESGMELATKSLKRYVVRGRGRAQPTHLAAKGKSRYGSRLRLQNAKRLLEEINAKLIEWRDVYGAADHVFYSAPAPLWSSLFEAQPMPPFERDGDVTKIPRDLPRPTTDLVVRTYKALGYGWIEGREREQGSG